MKDSPSYSIHLLEDGFMSQIFSAHYNMRKGTRFMLVKHIKQ